MSQTSVYSGQRDGPKIFKIGRIGFDSGSPSPLDLGSHTYTGVMRTGRFSPVGESGLLHFRRVAIRLLKSGDFTFTGRVWVDDERTKVHDNTTTGSPLEDQTVVIDGESTALREVTVELDINAVGTSIQVEIEVDSDDVTGLFLVETMFVHGRPIREAVSRDAEVE